MPKERLLQVGLNDLGRFAIGQDSKALYFDGQRVQPSPSAAGGQNLRRQIEEIVREVVNPRFNQIESLLRYILRRLPSKSREIAPPPGIKLKSSIPLVTVEPLFGEIHDDLITVRDVVAQAARQKHLRRLKNIESMLGRIKERLASARAAGSVASKARSKSFPKHAAAKK